MPSKQTKISILFLSVLVIGIFSARPVFGHYLWIYPEGENYVIARGIFPDRLDPYPSSAVGFIRAFDREDAEMDTERVDAHDRVMFRAQRPVSLAAVTCDWGGRVNTTQGKKLMTRKDAEQQGFKVLQAFLSTQTSKTALADGASVCRPLGLVLELVPLQSPFTLAPGEPLEIALMFNGAPLADTIVSTAEEVQAKTDGKGIARIAVSKAQWQVLMAKHIVPAPADTDINYHQFMTFFVFKGE